MSKIGIAIDIGTSTIQMSIFDIIARSPIHRYSFENPQVVYGEDVVTRIKARQTNSHVKKALTTLPRRIIASAISRHLTEHGIPREDVLEIIVVGNTAMHHLFFDLPTDALLEPPYSTEDIEARQEDPRNLGIDLPQATLYSPPLIQSFVGSDALCVIIASGILSDIDSSLALDLGTNAEVILQKNGSIWIGSAASGPAFEGMSLSCGMFAKEGAIDRVRVNLTEGTISYTTIGNIHPKGFCGVGAVSALAALRSLGLIDRHGSIVRNHPSDLIKQEGDFLRLCFHDSPISEIYLDQVDIRMLQQSKASIRAVIEVLMNASQCASDDISSLYITGAFGNGLDISSAVGIDMLPAFPNLRKTDHHVGGALAGAEELLWNTDLRDQIGRLPDSIRYIEMMDNTLYQEKHAKHLVFP